MRSFEVPAAGRTLRLGGRPWLMGVVNASPESFSDGAQVGTADAQLAHAAQLLAEGADIIDVGGESAITNREPLPVSEEIDRVVPVIERITRELGGLVSVDTYKPEVAEAAVAAGAVLVNDVSGLRDPALADVCAKTGAALLLMHTRAAPKQRLQDTGLYHDVTQDVVGFLADRMRVAMERGVPREALILDPGPDFAKTPSQTIEVLRHLNDLHALGRPLLMAVSRKDFIGALTGRRPNQRLAGTLAAVGYCVDGGGHILRVHDVGAVREYLVVRAALRGELAVDPGVALDESLRHERPNAGAAAE
ncbi:dihydropteroate synthase [Amycolatopsis vastitatis]|uniref:dihydropteroate synthase n=1 Tax=Amycolatopsis vastitatis TaxID=1905142 RepID=A0A229SZG7_9PSEU|nr:dihydropteroate synthase [Amycolatopsis vastitatis]